VEIFVAISVEMVLVIHVSQALVEQSNEMDLVIQKDQPMGLHFNAAHQVDHLERGMAKKVFHYDFQAMCVI
jgi:hypothetical protein